MFIIFVIGTKKEFFNILLKVIQGVKVIFIKKIW